MRKRVLAILVFVSLAVPVVVAQAQQPMQNPLGYSSNQSMDPAANQFGMYEPNPWRANIPGQPSMI